MKIHPPSGNHLFTMNSNERNHLVSIGWNTFINRTSPVFRLHNLGNGDYLLTVNSSEKDCCIFSDWIDEGVAWYFI
jgi:hypothetical protein